MSSYEGLCGEGGTRVGPWREGYDTPGFGGKKRKGHSKREELPEQTGVLSISMSKRFHNLKERKNQTVFFPPEQKLWSGWPPHCLLHSVLNPISVNLLLFLSRLPFLCNFSPRLVRKYMGFSVKRSLHTDANSPGLRKGLAL